MKDRFKFRVWNNREWDDEYGQVYYDAEKTYDYLDGKPRIPASSFGDLLVDGEWIPEQCTGLKDKNGNLIYEGDLIKEPSNSHNLKVIWENGAWQTEEYRKNGRREQLLYCLVNCYGVEIVGNIHENPELLEEKAE